MTNEYVTYKGIPSTCNVEKSLELQRWIIDPSSRPYETSTPQKQKQEFRTRSAAKQIEKRLSVDKALELQKKIIEGLH